MPVVNAEDFVINMKSNIAAVANRDRSVLGQLDRSMSAAVQRLGSLDSAAQKAAAASAAQARAVQDAAVSLQRLSAAKPDSIDAKAIRTAKSRLAAEQAKLNALRGSEKALGATAKAERANVDALMKGGKAAEGAAAAAGKAAAAKSKVRDASGALGSSVQALGGPLSSLGSRLSGLAPLAELSAGAIVALGASALAVALVAGAVAAYGALVRFGLAAAEARRQSLGLGEALSGVSRRPAQEFVSIVDRLASQVPQARGQLQALTQEMALLRLGGRDMQAAATAAAFTTAALGDSAGGAVKGIIQQSAAMRRFTLGARDMWGEFVGLAGTGLTKADVVGALAKEMGKSSTEVEKALILGRVKLKDGLRALEAASRARFGKTIEGQMESFSTQVLKAKERVGAMFRDVNLSPMIGGLAEVMTLLDESTVSGKAFRFLATTGVQAIVDALGSAMKTGGKFFQGMAIAALKAYIAIKPTYNSVRDFLGMRQSPSWLTAVNVGKVAFYALAGAVAVVGVSLLLASMPLILIGGLIYGVVVAIQAIPGAFRAAVDMSKAALAKLADVDLGKLGSFIIEGLIGALTNGVSRVAMAAADLALGAAGSFKRALGIASPSKLFGQYGRWTVQGYVQSVEAGQPEANEATAALGMGQPSVSVGGPTVNVSAPAGQGGNVFHIHLHGVQNGRQLLDELMALVGGARQMQPQEAT